MYTHRLHTETFTNRLFCTQKLYPEQFLHSIFFFAQMPLRKKNAQQFLQTDGFYTEIFSHRSLTHRKFYAQHFLHTDAFTHRCLYTDTNYTQKIVHTTRVYTQPTFTQFGFVSPSWSPTFRVPPLKFCVESDHFKHWLDRVIIIDFRHFCWTDLHRIWQWDIRHPPQSYFSVLIFAVKQQIRLHSFGGHRMFFLLSRFVLSGMVIECCGTVFARLVQSVFP